MTGDRTGDDALAADPFSWTVTKDGTIRISRGGRHVVAVGGSRAARLRTQLDAADDRTAQQLLARATGNYRRGNERR